MHFIKLQLKKMYRTDQDFLFKKSALFYYQSTMIFPKMFCDRSDSLPSNNMTLHWFLQLSDVQGSDAGVSYPVISQLWTVLTWKYIFPRGHACCGMLSAQHFDMFWWLLLEWLWYSSKFKSFLRKFLVQ